MTVLDNPRPIYLLLLLGPHLAALKGQAALGMELRASYMQNTIPPLEHTTDPSLGISDK